jgi:hypothetical protein
VRSWIRQQLGIQHMSYGSDSGDDSGLESGADEAEDAAGVPDGATAARGARAQPSTQQGRQQQRGRKSKQQQEQPAQPLRRSGRSNAGRMSAEFASTYGPVGCTQREGGVGLGSSQQASGAGILPSTPAATNKPRRARQGARGPV